MKPLTLLLRPALAYIAALSVAVNLLLLVPALFMLQVFDRVLASQSGDTLLVLLLGTAVALTLMLLLDYLRSRLQGVAGHLVADALSPAITRIAIAQGARRTGNPGPDALRDVATLRTLFSAQGLLAAFDAPWLVIYVGIIWIAHPALGIAAAASALLMLLLATLNDLITRTRIRALQHESAGVNRYLESSLCNAEVAQVLGMGNALVARWQARNADLRELQGSLASRSVLMNAAMRTLRQAVQVGMLALGAHLVIAGDATAGVMIATTVLLGRALAPVEQLVASWRVLAEGLLASRRLATMLEAPTGAAGQMTLPAPQGALAANQVVLRAPGRETAIIAGVSLQLHPGQVMAIIGPSGAGKSTLLRLLTGVWKPDAGDVRLDNADLGAWPRDHLGPLIGYVPQDVELFPGTVAENIARLGEVDGDKVVRAATRARVHQMVLALPDGYETRIEPGSAIISPGQRQRIALARALYGDPKLLLLDEPNSNLDGTGEAALAACLAELRGHVTVVLVTHRSTLMQHVDKILVLESGRARHYGPAPDVLRNLAEEGAAGARGGARVIEIQRPAKGDAALHPHTQAGTS